MNFVIQWGDRELSDEEQMAVREALQQATTQATERETELLSRLTDTLDALVRSEQDRRRKAEAIGQLRDAVSAMIEYHYGGRYDEARALASEVLAETQRV